MKNAVLVRLKQDSSSITYIWDPGKEEFSPLTEKDLSKFCPGFTRLNERARQKEVEAFIKHSKIVGVIRTPIYFPNVSKKLCQKHSSPKKFAEGSRAILATVELFETPRAGCMVLSDLLCGLHCAALREVEPGFHPITLFRSSAPEVQVVLKQIVKCVVQESRWKKKKCTFRRRRILDYRTKPGEFPHHIQDFSQAKRPIEEYKALKFPIPYVDTVALVIGADSPQVREAAPYLKDTCVILLNCDTGDFTPTKISSADIAAYSPEVLTLLKTKRNHIAALLHWWWAAFADEDAWARGIVQEARASFGKPDSRYIRVELDPRKLRDSIRYRVLLSFLDEVETYGFMAPEELEPYRQMAKDVFDPAPPEEAPVRHAEDPDVFVEVMKNLLAANTASIVAEGERYVKKDRHFAAWRSIGNTRYLVLDEDVWVKAYKKAVKERKELDASFFEKENWAQALQRRLAEDGKIKHTGNSFRYRYDLYDNGTKDRTYVVAIPAEILADQQAISQA